MKPTTFNPFPSSIRSSKAPEFYDRKFRSPPKQTTTTNAISRSPIFINESQMDPNDMKQMREMRFQALQEAIKGVYHHIIDDEILGTMKEDSSSTDFINQRVKEIFEEVIESDREIYIEKLMSQYTYMKVMYKQLEDEMRKTSKELENFKDSHSSQSDQTINEKRELQRERETLEDENRKLQAKIQSFSNNFNENMKKKDFDLQRSLEAKLEYETKIEVLQKQLKDNSVNLKTIRSELENERNNQKQIQHENEIIKGKFTMVEEQNRKLTRVNEEFMEKDTSYKNRFESIMEENRELIRKIEGLKEEMVTMEKEYQGKLNKIEEATKFNEESFQAFVENKNVKSKQKLESYKSKLVEYKQANANLENTVEELERALTQEKQHLHDYSEQLHNEFKEKEERNEEKIKEIERYYQEKSIEEKNELESQMRFSFNQQLEKYKSKKTALTLQYESKVSELEKTSIDKRTFEELLSKKDRIVEDLTNKLISYDKDQEIKLQKTLEVMEARKAAEYDQKLKAYYQNADSLEFALNEEKKKAKNIENELKETQEKLKEIINKNQELERILEEKHEENNQITNELAVLTENKEKIEEILQEKEQVFMRNQENFDRITIEIGFLSKSLEEKEALTRNQYKEIEKLQRNLSAQQEKCEKLQSDLFISQNNFADFENSSKENSKLMKQSLEMITFENQNLNIRLNSLQKENFEKFEEEKKNVANLKKELYVFELKLAEKEEKIQGLERINEKNEEFLKEIDQKYKSASQALNKSETLILNKENEKQRAFSMIKQMKRKFLLIIKEKFSEIKAHMRRLKANSDAICEEYQGLIVQQFSYLPNQIANYKRNQMNSFEEQNERLRYELELRFQREFLAIQQKNESYESEMKRKYEGQFEEWNRKSMDLTRKMEEIQNGSKKLQGEIYSLIKEKEANIKEIELLKNELEKALVLNQQINKEKSDLINNQEKIIQEFVGKIQEKAKKNEKKYVKTLKVLKKNVETLQEKNIKNLTEINEGVEALQDKYDNEIRVLMRNSNEKLSVFKEKITNYEGLLSDYKGKCSYNENIIEEKERILNEISEEKEQMALRYENHIYIMNQNLEEISSSMRQEKEKFTKELMDKLMEIDGLKNKGNRLENDLKRKEEEIYTMRNDKNRLNNQYEEALIKYNMKNSQCIKEVQEQIQEKKKYEGEVENLQNLLTKKYHKINQNKREEALNLDEKVKKLHDLEEELKFSLRTKTVVSPERGKVSTPMIRNKNDFNKQYYSNLMMKKNLGSDKK